MKIAQFGAKPQALSLEHGRSRRTYGKGDIRAGGGKAAPEVAADRAGTDDQDAHVQAPAAACP